MRVNKTTTAPDFIICFPSHFGHSEVTLWCYRNGYIPKDQFGFAVVNNILVEPWGFSQKGRQFLGVSFPAL
jgi:hypothetical protein